uniref:L1 transposable element RRM domain-containing protein n=1 Tax=Latimeria chalumnae TaxID=7897 RepID=H2ZUZ0_LATCH
IMGLLTQIFSTVSALNASISEIKETNAGFLTRKATIEQRISDSEDKLLKAESSITRLNAKISKPCARLDDQENRARRNNLQILGFPEGEVLPQLLCLPDNLDLDTEWAHHSLGPRPTAGQRPCPFIIKLLHFPIKELVLKKARDSKSLEWEGNKILIFPDISKDLQEKRKLFQPVKKLLRAKEIKYSLFYPAVLKIMWKGETKAFTNPKDAEIYAR